MGSTYNLIACILIILMGLCNVILLVIDGLAIQSHLIEFILSCLIILTGVIGICREIKNKNSEK